MVTKAMGITSVCGCWCHRSQDPMVIEYVLDYYEQEGTVPDCRCSCYPIICDDCGGTDCQCN